MFNLFPWFLEIYIFFIFSLFFYIQFFGRREEGERMKDFLQDILMVENFIIFTSIFFSSFFLLLVQAGAAYTNALQK